VGRFNNSSSGEYIHNLTIINFLQSKEDSLVFLAMLVLKEDSVLEEHQFPFPRKDFGPLNFIHMTFGSAWTMG